MSTFRKTPLQQIESAREALQKALARQRRHDAHSKIVMGSLTHTWMLNDARAARAFLSHLDGIQIRQADVEVINVLRSELNDVIKKANPIFTTNQNSTAQT